MQEPLPPEWRDDALWAPLERAYIVPRRPIIALIVGAYLLGKRFWNGIRR